MYYPHNAQRKEVTDLATWGSDLPFSCCLGSPLLSPVSAAPRLLLETPAIPPSWARGSLRARTDPHCRPQLAHRRNGPLHSPFLCRYAPSRSADLL
jgi:hypothetical protein